MHHRVFLAGAALAALAIPSAAHAAAVTLDRTCYVEGDQMVLGASGFTPGAALEVRSTGLMATAAADGSGALKGGVGAPDNPGGGPRAISSFVLTVAESANQAVSAQTPFQVANFAFSTSTGAQSPASKRIWRFSGFPEGETIYGHFIRRGRVRANYRFGKADGPCGTLERKAPGIPVRKAASGKWRIQIDTTRRYSKNTTVGGREPLVGTTKVFVKSK
jgi:hypothetical protein